MSQLTATVPCPQCNELGTSKWDCLGELDYPTEHDLGHEGTKTITLTEEIQQHEMRWHAEDMNGATRRWVSERVAV